MTTTPGSTAVVYLSNHPMVSARQNDLIKRLALIFDRIEYLLPEVWGFDEETLEMLKKSSTKEAVQEAEKESIYFDPLYHPVGTIQYPLDLFDGELPRTIEVLENHGIARMGKSFERVARLNDDLYKKVKQILAWEESRDPVFRSISRTTDDDFNMTPVPITVTMYGEWDSPPPLSGDYEPTGTMDLYVFDPPRAILDSAILSDVLYDSSLRGSCPVLLSGNHRLELRRRYQLYQEGINILAKHGAEDISGSGLGATFGEVSFVIVNGTIGSELISTKSIEDIVKYRNANEDARKKFISEHLWEATKLVEDNPWDQKTRDELERYIRGELATAIITYQGKTAETWEKLWGTIPVRFAEMGRDAVIGGVTGFAVNPGGVLGEVVPGISGLGMTLIAGAIGASRKAPDLLRDIIDTMHQSNSMKRSGVAYMANFR